jgi:hypothetical protein
MNWLSSLRKMADGNEEERGFLRVPEDKDESISAGEAPTKQDVIDATCYYTCSRMCYGTRGQSGICCTLGERDYIIGPITDTERFLADLSKKLGETVKFADVFMEYEEGSKMFPDRKCWQEPKNYPCMRVVNDPSRGYPCQLLSLDMKCTVHSIKPKVCRDYLCDYLQNVVTFLDDTL